MLPLTGAWSTYQGLHRPLQKTTPSPCSSYCQQLLGRAGTSGSPLFMLGLSLTWDRTGLAHTVTAAVEFFVKLPCLPREQGFLVVIHLTMALKVFLALLLQWCLSFRKGYEIAVAFRAEHSAETNCRFLSITIHCKRKLLWLGLIEAFIYGLNKIDRSQFNADLYGYSRWNMHIYIFKPYIYKWKKTYNIVFWVWVTSLGMTVSSFNHLPVDFMTQFSFQLNKIPLCKYTTFSFPIHQLLNIQVVFIFLKIGNKTAMNMDEQVSL